MNSQTMPLDKTTKPGGAPVSLPTSDDSPRRNVNTAGSMPCVGNCKLQGYARMHPNNTAILGDVSKVIGPKF